MAWGVGVFNNNIPIGSFLSEAVLYGLINGFLSVLFLFNSGAKATDNPSV